MVEFSDIVQFLSAISAVAVLAGVVFVVFQLRQNAKLIEAANTQAEATLQQHRSDVALSIMTHFTQSDFTKSRKTVRDIIAKYRVNDWKGFLETPEDFEVRAFGAYYEFVAYLARENIVDIVMLQDVLGYRLTFDWDAFAPVATYHRQVYGKKYLFANFEWLAGLTRKYLEEKEKAMPGTITVP